MELPKPELTRASIRAELAQWSNQLGEAFRDQPDPFPSTHTIA
jgi:hypothetical protein